MTETRRPALSSLPSFFMIVLTISAAFGVRVNTGDSVTVDVMLFKPLVGSLLEKGDGGGGHTPGLGSMLIDVSQPVTPRTAPWPGDEPFSCGWSVETPGLRVGW